MSLKLRFSGANVLTAWAVKLYTWSWVSHVETIIEDSNGKKRLFGALPKTGVGFRSIDSTDGDRVEDYEVCISKIKQIIYMQKLLSQQGKPYDIHALIDMVIHVDRDRDWKDESCWFCSELVTWALVEAGAPPIRVDHLNRITPKELLLSPLLKRIA